MIQFITNHPYWTGIILYLIIGLISGVQYYCEKTWLDLDEGYGYSKNQLLSENLFISYMFIFIWFLYLIADAYTLYIAVNNRYNKSKINSVDTSKDWPENY